ncbi:MAG: thiamine phosphate synthase [Dehalococcoidia bacterium]|nr:thiamine phosphate synthase [Dehalococcoidia bacterium]
MSTSARLSALRMADANANRCNEGLRVLEDVARFVLDNSELTSLLRELRHNIVKAVANGLNEYVLMLGARHTEQDVGYKPAGDIAPRTDLVELVVANAKRAQQSLRVLEELGRLPHFEIQNTAFFQSARYRCYQIEQQLVSLLARRDKLDRLPGLYAIIDPEMVGAISVVEAARQAVLGGASVVQLRDKKRERGAILQDAVAIKELCAVLGAIFIVNDYPDVAAACAADGVHLGQQDMTVEAARKVLPYTAVIGRSTATVEEALRAVEDGADYVAVGAIFPTDSKSDTRPAGLETLKRVREAVSVPIVAIGGINADNLSQVVMSGADGVAVISALLKQDDVRGAASILTVRFKESYARPIWKA